jgi:hypothetical protein
MTNTTCHPGSATTKAMASASTKRRTLATVLAIAATMGHSDGATYADCVACGSRAYVGRAQTDRAGFNLGHVVSDASGGRYCACNLLPMCRACNSDLGDVTLTDALVPRYDGRATWSGVMVADTGARETTDDAPRGRAAWLTR